MEPITFPTKSCRFKKLTKKRHMSIWLTNGDLETFGTWWDGGSKAEYEWFNLVTGERTHIDTNQNGAFDSRPATTVVEPKAGYCVLKTGWFCGKESSPMFKVFTHGDDTLGKLIAGYIMGDVSWEIVCDRYRDLCLME